MKPHRVHQFPTVKLLLWCLVSVFVLGCSDDSPTKVGWDKDQWLELNGKRIVVRGCFNNKRAGQLELHQHCDSNDPFTLSIPIMSISLNGAHEIDLLDSHETDLFEFGIEHDNKDCLVEAQLYVEKIEGYPDVDVFGLLGAWVTDCDQKAYRT